MRTVLLNLKTDNKADIEKTLREIDSLKKKLKKEIANYK